MHGEEKEVRHPVKLGQRTVTALTEAQKMDLVSFSSMSTAQTLYLLMENEILEARDAAMAADPADEKRVLALQAQAHAMALFYTRLKKSIENAINEHLGIIAEKATEEALRDQEEIERIVISNCK